MQLQLAPSSEILAPEYAAACGSAASDPLSDVLRTVKLTGALFFLFDASSPWGMAVPGASIFGPVILPRAQHIISYHIITQGSGWVSVDGQPPVQFAVGDVLVFPHGAPYAMLSAPDQHAEASSETALQFFRAMAAGELSFVITKGGGGDNGVGCVCGFLGCDTRPFNPLLATLPRMIHMQRPAGAQDDLLDRLIELTIAEAPMRRAGGECIRLRLGELLFIEVVRRYLDTLPAGQTGWLVGLRDPAVGRCLRVCAKRYDWVLADVFQLPDEIAGKYCRSGGA